MKVHELLDAPEKWTQGAFARDDDGADVDFDDKAASSWCLLGALTRCYDDASAAGSVHERQLYDRVKEHLGVMSLSEWNDAIERTHAEVRALALELDI